MEVKKEYFEIKSKNGAFGLAGYFKTEAEALDEINRSHRVAVERGYDGHEEWAIYCVQFERLFSDDGILLREETVRFYSHSVSFDEYENKYVFSV